MILISSIRSQVEREKHERERERERRMRICIIIYTRVGCCWCSKEGISDDE
jgi:hypothetical protein